MEINITNSIALLQILDRANLINDEEFKDYNFMSKSESEIKKQVIKILKREQIMEVI